MCIPKNLTVRNNRERFEVDKEPSVKNKYFQCEWVSIQILYSVFCFLVVCFFFFILQDTLEKV